MAIMAVAAIASGAGVAAGVVTIATVAMVGVGLTVVGLVTKNETLMKIGAGLGIGAAGAGMLGLGSASSAAASTASTAAAESTVAGVGEGVAASAAPAATIGSTPVAGMAGQTAEAMISAPAQSATQLGSGMANLNPALGTGVGADSLASAGMASSLPQTSMAGVQGIQGADSWFDSIGDVWKGLDAGGKSAVAQAGMGLVSGVGKGLLQGMSDKEKLEAEQAERERRAANLRGVPNVGLAVNPNYKMGYAPIGLINQAKAA